MINFKPNFENSGSDQESINVNLDEDIETEQRNLEEGVSDLVEKTQNLANADELPELSETEAEALVQDIDEVKGEVVRLSESGFITPEFSLRLAAIVGGMGLLYNPEILDSIPGDAKSKIVFGAIMASIWGLFSVARNQIRSHKAKWYSEDKGYEFVDWDVDSLLERWGAKGNKNDYE